MSKKSTKLKQRRLARKRRQAQRPYQAAARPAVRRVRARQKIERFHVDPARSWYVVQAIPLRATRCALALRVAGLPVFEARQEQKLVDPDNGKARIAKVPILRRVMFVGCADQSDIDAIAGCPWANRVLCNSDETPWVDRERFYDASPVIIGAKAMERFADHLTGHLRDDEAVAEVFAVLFAVGEAVRLKSGTLAAFTGTVDAVDEVAGTYKVAVKAFGRDVTVEAHEEDLVAA